MTARILAFDAPLPRLLYWDASFLAHATYPASRYHAECYAFLELLSSADDTLSYVSTLALDETIFALLQLKVAEDHPGVGFWEAYRQDAAIIRPYLGERRALVDRLWIDPLLRTLDLAPPRQRHQRQYDADQRDEQQSLTQVPVDGRYHVHVLPLCDGFPFRQQAGSCVRHVMLE